MLLRVGRNVILLKMTGNFTEKQKPGLFRENKNDRRVFYP